MNRSVLLATAASALVLACSAPREDDPFDDGAGTQDDAADDGDVYVGTNGGGLARISDGKVRISVPHFSRGFTHPEHKSGFDVTFPYYFRADFLGGYQGVEFALEDLRLRWFAQPYLKKTVVSRRAFRAASAAGRAINAVANASPELCSRLWCNWVGGFEEIEFRFAVVKG